MAKKMQQNQTRLPPVNLMTKIEKKKGKTYFYQLFHTGTTINFLPKSDKKWTKFLLNIDDIFLSNINKL